jgi:protein gp37
LVRGNLAGILLPRRKRGPNKFHIAVSSVTDMSDRSDIEWTDATWNPVRGCTKISPGCKFCYAETFAERFRGVPGHPFEQGFDLRLVSSAIDLPRRWKAGRFVFVNSMSDLLHDEVPLDYIRRVFRVMEECPQHQFQVLTKRAERLAQLASKLPWPENVWMGVSVENAKYTSRVLLLRRVPAHVRFLSVEPLIGPIDKLPLDGIHWVIVGGESGRKPRPLDPAWARSLRDQCVGAGVPFFFKQWGGRNKKAAGRLLDGREWNELPAQASRSPLRVVA